MRRSAYDVTLVLLVLACAEPGSGPDTATAPSLAKGGGASPTISSADPTWTTQDTTIEVRVFGSGFDNGSRADWAIDGVVVPAQVVTNSTRFVSSGELVANITISSTATPVLYDIVVTTLLGKKGIGAEKFEVAPKGSVNPRFTNPAASFVWTDQTGLSGGGISGDHRTGSGTASGDATSTYEDGKCGVASNLWLSRWGDATNNPIDSRKSCGAVRSLIATFGAPLSAGSPVLSAASGDTSPTCKPPAGIGLWGQPRDG
jgi:hypothetical protein